MFCLRPVRTMLPCWRPLRAGSPGAMKAGSNDLRPGRPALPDSWGRPGRFEQACTYYRTLGNERDTGMAYANTVNKAAIRTSWDFPILRHWRETTGLSLTYFGLTGPEIWDLLDWRTVLDRRRTAVESPGHTVEERRQADETLGRLNSNIMA